jgi:acyl carrier protein
MELGEFCRRLLELLQIDPQLSFGPDDTLFDTIGLDSFQAFQLIVIVEALADVDVPPVDIPEMYTLRDTYSYYLTLRSSDVTVEPS